MAVESVPSLPRHGSGQRFEPCGDSETEECWICLSSAGQLTRPCECPRVCHRECIATWQLTNYGRREENFCRFCSKRLPALWKPDPTQELAKEELRVAPVMAVRYNGPEGTREFKMRVRPGPEGLAMFKAHLKEILGFDVGPEFDVTFECQMPATGSLVTLSGLNAYGAATHCAALLAATKAGSPQPAAAAPRTGAIAPAEAVPVRGTRQTSAPSQQQRPVVPMVPAASRSVPADRRACQTGYLPSRPNPPLWANAQRDARSSLAARGSRAPLAHGADRQRPWGRTASDTANFEGGAGCSDVQDSYDELLPFGPREVVAATPVAMPTVGYCQSTSPTHHDASRQNPASERTGTRALAPPQDLIAGGVSPFLSRQAPSEPAALSRSPLPAVVAQATAPVSGSSARSEASSSLLGPLSSNNCVSSSPSSGLLSITSLPAGVAARKPHKCSKSAQQEPSPSKLHLPSILRCTAKRTMESLMRALRHAKK